MPETRKKAIVGSAPSFKEGKKHYDEKHDLEENIAEDWSRINSEHPSSKIQIDN